MKKLLFTLIAMLSIAVQANAMSYEQARNEALFLTDKMAYELNLNDAQYEAAYEINLDYLMSVTNRDNVFSIYWEHRNCDLQYILYPWQWEAFIAAHYFYRPLIWEAGYWHFTIYARYPHRSYFYFGRPHFYATYRGAHSWHHNGGRSYYEHHHSVYRPHASRDHHLGMRDGWNRGDYNSNRHTYSSTRVTGGNYRNRTHDNTSGNNRNRSNDNSGDNNRNRSDGNTGGGNNHTNNNNYGTVNTGSPRSAGTGRTSSSARQNDIRSLPSRQTTVHQSGANNMSTWQNSQRSSSSRANSISPRSNTARNNTAMPNRQSSIGNITPRQNNISSSARRDIGNRMNQASSRINSNNRRR